jgi:uncharacterized membrane protein YcjF (UPF0283 family)
MFGGRSGEVLFINKLKFTHKFVPRSLKNPSNNERFFKFYCFYAFGFACSFSIILWQGAHYTFYSYKNHVLFYVQLSLHMVAVADVFFIVMTIRKIVQLAKDESSKENLFFEVEKER